MDSSYLNGFLVLFLSVYDIHFFYSMVVDGFEDPLFVIVKAR